MTRPDPDTLQKGTNGPFEPWESDHTALYHVLRSARFQGLTLESDADEIAHLILGSRWMAARQQRARDDATDRIVKEEQKLQEAILKDPTSSHLSGMLAALQRARSIVQQRADL